MRLRHWIGSLRPPVLHGRLSLWIKVPYTLWIAVLVPVWLTSFGWTNFLWLSDIALLGMLVALWWEHRLLASMMIVGTLVLELIWCGAFLASLIQGESVGMVSYMFDDANPLYRRGLSLFHLFLPPLELWVVWRLGYDRRALAAQTLLLWVILPASYVLGSREANLNYVHGFGEAASRPVPQGLWFTALMIGLPLLVHAPLHWLLARWIGPDARSPRGH